MIRSLVKESSYHFSSTSTGHNFSPFVVTTFLKYSFGIYPSPLSPSVNTTLEKLDPILKTLLQIQINQHRTTIPHPTDNAILAQQSRRKMDMISLHPLQALGIIRDGLPGSGIGPVNDGGIIRCGENGRHFHLNGFNTVSLVCPDKFFWSIGGF